MRRTLIPLAGLALLAAGCGSSGHSSGTVPSLGKSGSSAKATSTATSSTESKLLAFSKCMRENGMPDWPDPVTDADGNTRLQFPKNIDPSSGALTNARTACSSYLKGIAQGFTQADRSAMQDTLLQFTRCMRTNGVDIPDPDFTKNGGLGTLSKIDRNDPRNAKALKACNSFLQKLMTLTPGGK